MHQNLINSGTQSAAGQCILYHSLIAHIAPNLGKNDIPGSLYDIVIFRKPRIIETRNEAIIEISETQCPGVAGIPVALELWDYGDIKRAHILGVPVSRSFDDNGVEKAKGILIENASFKKLMENKVHSLYGPIDRFTYRKPVYAAR